MFKMSTIGRNARVQTFAKVVDIYTLLIDVCGKSSRTRCSVLLALGWSLALTEVCEMLEASHPTQVVEWLRSDEFVATGLL